MATEIKTWQLVNGVLQPVSTPFADNEKESALEKWIKSKPEILGDDIAIIGEQVRTKSGPLDFLGIDRTGNTVIIELKRDKLAREVLAQAIDYASDLDNYEMEQLDEICQEFTKQPLVDHLTERFPDMNLEEISVNQTQRLLLVGFKIDEPLHRMIEWLSEKFNMAINAIVIHYVKTQSGDELLSRTVIIPEDLEREKANRKKFGSSDVEGTYSDDELRERLAQYLSSDLSSAQQIRDYVLPILLQHQEVTREQMRSEASDMKAAGNGSQTKLHLASVSVQFGKKENDFLRQIISFEHSSETGKRENFSIKAKYKALVEEVLEKLKDRDKPQPTDFITINQ